MSVATTNLVIVHNLPTSNLVATQLVLHKRQQGVADSLNRAKFQTQRVEDGSAIDAADVALVEATARSLYDKLAARAKPVTDRGQAFLLMGAFYVLLLLLSPACRDHIYTQLQFNKHVKLDTPTSTRSRLVVAPTGVGKEASGISSLLSCDLSAMLRSFQALVRPAFNHPFCNSYIFCNFNGSGPRGSMRDCLSAVYRHCGVTARSRSHEFRRLQHGTALAASTPYSEMVIACKQRNHSVSTAHLNYLTPNTAHLDAMTDRHMDRLTSFRRTGAITSAPTATAVAQSVQYTGPVPARLVTRGRGRGCGHLLDARGGKEGWSEQETQFLFSSIREQDNQGQARSFSRIHEQGKQLHIWVVTRSVGSLKSHFHSVNHRREREEKGEHRLSAAAFAVALSSSSSSITPAQLSVLNEPRPSRAAEDLAQNSEEKTLPPPSVPAIITTSPSKIPGKTPAQLSVLNATITTGSLLQVEQASHLPLLRVTQAALSQAIQEKVELEHQLDLARHTAFELRQEVAAANEASGNLASELTQAIDRENVLQQEKSLGRETRETKEKSDKEEQKTREKRGKQGKSKKKGKKEKRGKNEKREKKVKRSANKMLQDAGCYGNENKIQGSKRKVVDDDGGLAYDVERIVKRRYQGSTKSIQYLVKWVGYDNTTWEPERNISDDLIKEYEGDGESNNEVIAHIAPIPSPSLLLHSQVTRKHKKRRWSKEEKEVLFDLVDEDENGKHNFVRALQIGQGRGFFLNRSLNQIKSTYWSGLRELKKEFSEMND